MAPLPSTLRYQRTRLVVAFVLLLALQQAHAQSSSRSSSSSISRSGSSSSSRSSSSSISSSGSSSSSSSRIISSSSSSSTGTTIGPACPFLPVPTWSRITYNGPTLRGEGVPAGTTASYTCYPVGSFRAIPDRVCRSNGWSGTDPTCTVLVANQAFINAELWSSNNFFCAGSCSIAESRPADAACQSSTLLPSGATADQWSVINATAIRIEYFAVCGGESLGSKEVSVVDPGLELGQGCISYRQSTTSVPILYTFSVTQGVPATVCRQQPIIGSASALNISPHYLFAAALLSVVLSYLF